MDCCSTVNPSTETDNGKCLGAGLDPTDINNAPFLWHKGEDFKKGPTAIPLMYRMATTADVKPAHGKKFSRYLWKMPVKKVRCSLSQHHSICFESLWCTDFPCNSFSTILYLLLHEVTADLSGYLACVLKPMHGLCSEIQKHQPATHPLLCI